jgi:GPH family glycoside/pentoside/hexuronide:cation symporter
MSEARPKEFTWYEGLAFCLSAIGIQLNSEYLSQFGHYFYSPTVGGGRIVYITIGLILPMFVVGRFFDAITDPLAGVWSDETSRIPGRWRLLPIRGRRRPFVFWGSILMTFTGVAYWYPPVPGTSVVNFIYGSAMLCLHFAFFTVCVVPLVAMAPEVARSQQARIKLGVWIAVGMILGLALAAAISGTLIDVLDPARRAAAAEGGVPAFSPVGYQRTAIVFAAISLFVFQFAVWVVREREPERSTTQPRTIWSAYGDMFDVMRNRVFLRYITAIFLFSLGYLATQRVLPNWAETGLGGDESTVTMLLLPFIGSALVMAFVGMPILGRILPVKWLLVMSFIFIGTGLPMMYPIAALPLESETRFLLGALLFGYCGLGQGMQYVLLMPMLGEIIDLDEKTSGRRREGSYNGVNTMAVKAGQALSIALSNVCMSTFGNSVENPTGILLVGPMAGVFAFLGLAVVWRYPVLHVTRETASES